MGASLLDARNGHPLHLRNLGANFIEHSIKTAQLDDNQQQALKNQFWSLVFCEFGAFDSLNEKVLLKEKVASCMAHLACKLWLRPEDDPLQWNEFFECGILENVLKAQNVTGNEHLRRQEFALLTISYLINFIRWNDSKISEERRLQLHSGLEIVLPPFIDWLFKNFPLAVSSKVSRNVLNAAIRCFNSFCTWMGNLRIEGIKNFLNSCFIILLNFSGDSELDLNILDTLQNYFSIKGFSPAEHEILEFYLIQLFPQVCQLIQIYTSATGEEAYQKLKLLLQTYLSIGNRYICNQKNPLVTNNLNEIFNLFLALGGQIQSLTIYLDLMEFWSNCFKCPALQLKFDLKPHLTQLFWLIAMKMTTNERKSVFNELDFEEVSEFKEFRKLSNSRSTDLLKLLTCKFPIQILEFAYNALGTFIQSQNFTETLKWEGLLIVLESVSKGCEINVNDKIKNFYLLHLQLFMVHCPLPKENSVLIRWISCVKNFTALLSLDCPVDDFRRSVEGLFNIAITMERPENVRSLAAISILKLADSNPSLFLPLLEPLLVAISPLLNVNSAGSWERKLFSELILIFMSQPTLPADKQMVLFATVADPLVDLLKNAKSVLLSGNDPVLSLMKRIGFDEIVNSAPISDSCRKFTSDLNLLLSTLQILFKRIAPLVQNQPQSPVVLTCLQVLDELIGFLMLMIQCVHRMGTKQTWTAYFNSEIQYETLYHKMQEFLETGTGQSDGDNESDDTQLQLKTKNSTSTALIHIAGWSRYYRQTSYLVLGCAAGSFGIYFYSLPNLAERFMSQPLSSLESLNLADWSVLLKLLLKPILTCAPRELVPILIGGSLTGLLSLLTVKLEQEWELVLLANTSSKPATGTALTLEMSRESKCNILSSGFVAFLCELLNAQSIDSSKNISLLYALERDDLLPKIEDENDPLSSIWLFSEAPESLLFGLFDFTCKSMTTWPRSVGVYNRLINILNKLINGIMGRQDLPNRAVMLSKTISCTFDCWRLSTWTEFHSALLTIFTEQYKWAFLLAAIENYSGPMIFDPDTVKFVKNSKVPLTLFENELEFKFKIPQSEILSLRQQILCTETSKQQKIALRSLLRKYTKPVELVEDLKQKEFTNRLTDMKKRISRNSENGNIENVENFDSLLSDLFNA